MKYLAMAFLSLLPSLIYAQSTDHYWQQLVGVKEAQSSLQIVQLAKKIDDLQAELDKAKKECAPKGKPDAK